MIKNFVAGLLFIALGLFSVAHASTIDHEEYKAQIREIERYLNSFTSLESRFMQTNPENVNISRGKIYISRPGKARLEYIDPNNMLLIIKDGSLTLWDKELDQISYADVPPTPFEALLYKNLDLSNKVKIENFRETDDTISITVSPDVIPDGEDAEHGAFESLTLIFRKNPIALTRLQRTDENNTTVTITLIDPKLDSKMNDELFNFKNPRIYNRKKRN